MDNDKSFEKYLETHCNSIKRKLNNDLVNTNIEENYIHSNKKTSRYHILLIAIVACCILGGWSYINNIFHDRAINDHSPIELEASGNITKPNMSIKYKNLVINVKGVLAEKERTLIVLEVDDSKLSNIEILKSDMQYTHLIDSKGKVYNIKRWGGGTLSSSKSPNEMELEFEGLPLESASTVIIFNKLNGEDGEWKLTLPVKVIKPIELNTNIISKKEEAVLKINNICLSGSIIKISGNVSKDDGTWTERFQKAYLKTNNKMLLDSEIAFEKDGDFYILFSSTAMNGPLDIVLEWNKDKNTEIFIPIK